MNNQITEESDESSLDNETSDKKDSSILEVVVEKFSSVEQTINLLKKEIANHLPGQQQASSSSKNENDINKIEATKMKVEGREFEGLNELLSDLKVKHMIKTVAGSDTHDLINNAMESINSKSTIDDKRADLSSRILQLHSNLRGKIDNINKDSKFTMALGIAGLNRSNIKLD